MKFKDGLETCGLTKEHGYLGHFTQAKHMNRGHNSDSIFESKNPVITKVYDNEPSLALGQGPIAQAKAKQERSDLLDRLKRTKMIEGGVK